MIVYTKYCPVQAVSKFARPISGDWTVKWRIGGSSHSSFQQLTSSLQNITSRMLPCTYSRVWVESLPSVGQRLQGKSIQMLTLPVSLPLNGLCQNAGAESWKVTPLRPCYKGSRFRKHSQGAHTAGYSSFCCGRASNLQILANRQIHHKLAMPRPRNMTYE